MWLRRPELGQQVTDVLLSQDEPPEILTYTDGDDYLLQVTPNLGSHDTALTFSADGAQLYQNKKSDFWMYVWVIYGGSRNHCSYVD